MSKIELGNEILKLVKKTELTVVSVETRETENTMVLTLELPGEIFVVGSQVTPEGRPISTTSNKVQVLGDDILAFQKNFKDGKYSGTMKLDVTKPKGRMNGDKYEITTPPKIQLCSISLKDFGTGNSRKRNDAASEALNSLFRTPEDVKKAVEAAKNAAAASVTNKTNTKPEIVGQEEKN